MKIMESPLTTPLHPGLLLLFVYGVSMISVNIIIIDISEQDLVYISLLTEDWLYRGNAT